MPSALDVFGLGIGFVFARSRCMLYMHVHAPVNKNLQICFRWRIVPLVLRSQDFKTFRISAELCRDVAKVAEMLGHVSENHVVERSVREMLELINSVPDDRNWPSLVVQVDAAREHLRSPKRLKR
jgi:hypothetical protein